MDYKFLTVSFSNFAATEMHNANSLSVPDVTLVNKSLLEQGYTALLFEDIPFCPHRASIISYLSDLLYSYIRLEIILARNLAENHVAYLNDGMLIIVGERTEKIVKVTVTSVPRLEFSLMQSTTFDTTFEAYLYSWRKLVGQILTAANFTPPPSSDEGDDQ